MILSIILDVLLLAQQVQQPQTSIWVLIISAIIASGTLATVLTLIFNRRKTNAERENLDADAADIIQRAAGELVTRIKKQSDEDRAAFQIQINSLTEQNTLLRSQNDELIKTVNEMRVEVQKIPELEKDIKDLRHGIDLLTAQLIEHGVQPAYPPVPPINF